MEDTQADDTLQLECRRITAKDTIPLRHAVLWPDAPLSAVLLPSDAAGHHFGAFLPGAPAPIAVISLFLEPVPVPAPSSSPNIPPAVRFRKFACAPAHQGLGIGTRLLQHAAAEAAALGGQVLWCDARAASCAWYERRGLVAFGDTFQKSGVEYVRMRAELPL